MNKSPKDQINEAAMHLPQQMIVIESGIDPQILKEYFEQATLIAEANDLEEKQFHVNLFEEALFDTEVNEKGKQIMLINLAQVGSIEAYRVIEKFVNTTSDENLKKWALLALQECRMSVESELTDETQGYILSGLGGKSNKLRYFFAVAAYKNTQLSPYQHQLVELELKSNCTKYQAEIEEVRFASQYISFVLLVPLEVAVGQIIEDTIDQCNEMGNFLMPNFLVTNVLIPTEEMMDELVDDLQNDRLDSDEEEDADAAQ